MADDRSTPTGSPPGTPPAILVTAGPTQEPIDEVRYLGNRSSGRMGMAIAAAAAARCWPVTLLLGPVEAGVPQSDLPLASLHRFRSTADLAALLAEHWPAHDVLVMAAAVADYRVRGGPRAGKIRRSDGEGDAPVLALEPTPDLLAAAAAGRRPDQRIVGFALEPADQLRASADAKLRRKGLDAIVANPLETIGAATVSATLIRADGTSEDAPPDLDKAAFAAWLLDLIESLPVAAARNSG